MRSNSNPAKATIVRAAPSRVRTLVARRTAARSADCAGVMLMASGRGRTFIGLGELSNLPRLIILNGINTALCSCLAYRTIVKLANRSAQLTELYLH